MIVGAVVAVACGGDGGTSGDGELTVFAAASLTAAFTELGEAFEAEDRDVTVTFNFAASSELAAQVLEGAPVDVFASADAASMARLTDADATDGEPVVFATNAAAIVVAPGNPLGITGLADLADDDLVVVACAPEVPCGRYATQVLDLAGVDLTPRSFEENVRAVVSKVVLGEADAGIAYVTDVLAAGEQASGVAIPDEVNVVAEYPIAVVADAAAPGAARRFVEFVRSDPGREILASNGFGTP